MTAADLRKLLAEATPGPWMGGTYMDENQRTWFDISVDPGDFGVANGLGDADAALIVYLRNHAEHLADLIDAAEKSIQTGVDEEGVEWFALDPRGQKDLFAALHALQGNTE